MGSVSEDRVDMNLIFKHNIVLEDSSEHWHLRGISEAGKFYGEIRKELPTAQKIYLWTGQLSEAESDEIQNLAHRLDDEFESPDLAGLRVKVRTSVSSGLIGVPATCKRLAGIDRDGVSMPQGCIELVDRMLQIISRYNSGEYLEPFGSTKESP